MPRTCTVCAHPDREEVDAALVRGVTPYALESTYSDLTRESIQRHSVKHLPGSLLKAREAEEIANADNLLDEIRDLQRKTYGILGKAEAAEDLKTALSAIREARGNLELLAKLAQLIDERPQINLNVSPEWLELRAVIVGALGPHPAAHRAVLSALEGAGNG